MNGTNPNEFNDGSDMKTASQNESYIPVNNESNMRFGKFLTHECFYMS